MRSHFIYFLLFMVLMGINGFTQDSSIPGVVSTPYPTVLNLAVEWNIRGDDNQNGIVKVQYREKGEKIWKKSQQMA